jgi:hypothetical protein
MQLDRCLVSPKVHFRPEWSLQGTNSSPSCCGSCPELCPALLEAILPPGLTIFPGSITSTSRAVSPRNATLSSLRGGYGSLPSIPHVNPSSPCLSSCHASTSPFSSTSVLSSGSTGLKSPATSPRPHCVVMRPQSRAVEAEEKEPLQESQDAR